MKRTMFLLTAILALGLVFGGCKKKEEAKPEEPANTEETKPAEPAKTEEAKPAEPAKEEAKTEEAKAEPAAAGDPEKDCGALHDMMKQMMEALTAKLGKAAKPKKEFPSREKFVEACKVLPPEVVRCMNPKVAMQEQEKCQEVMKNANKEQIAKFKAIMGGK